MYKLSRQLADQRMGQRHALYRDKMSKPIPIRIAYNPERSSWENIVPEQYKAEGENSDWAKIVRHQLTGQRGENTNFHLRYFEIAPGGNSTLESHIHEHVVVGVRGVGKALIEGESYPVNFMDIIYVAPSTEHQFLNVTDEPFGFLCIVDAVRDKPLASSCELT